MTLQLEEDVAEAITKISLLPKQTLEKVKLDSFIKLKDALQIKLADIDIELSFIDEYGTSD